MKRILIYFHCHLSKIRQEGGEFLAEINQKHFVINEIGFASKKIKRRAAPLYKKKRKSTAPLILREIEITNSDSKTYYHICKYYVRQVYEDYLHYQRHFQQYQER
jgi:dihydroorotate dehydrogenase